MVMGKLGAVLHLGVCSPHCLRLEVYLWEVKMVTASLSSCLPVSKALSSSLHRRVFVSEIPSASYTPGVGRSTD